MALAKERAFDRTLAVAILDSWSDGCPAERLPMANTRTEKDSLGTMQVPVDALYGA